MLGHSLLYLVQQIEPLWCYRQFDHQPMPALFYLCSSANDPTNPCPVVFSPSSHILSQILCEQAFSLPSRIHKREVSGIVSLKDFNWYHKRLMAETRTLLLPRLLCYMQFPEDCLGKNCNLCPLCSSSPSALPYIFRSNGQTPRGLRLRTRTVNDY